MAAVIRPLTYAERRKPAQQTYVGGFKNVSFQIGSIEMPTGAEKNANDSTAGVTKCILHKSDKVRFPIFVPHSMSVLKGVQNTVASVMGRKNIDGTYDAILVARSSERLSSFNSRLRTVLDLLEDGAEGEDKDNPGTIRLGKGVNAKVHNQVMLCGVIVGAYYEDGDHPAFHILLRQDNNPNNVIPLIYPHRNASQLQKTIRYGAFTYVDGEYAYRNVPVPLLGPDKTIQKDKDGKVIYEKDEEGNVKKRVQTYIRIDSPRDPAEFDTRFGGTHPQWLTELAEEVRRRKVRKTAVEGEGADEKSAQGPVVTAADDAGIDVNSF